MRGVVVLGAVAVASWIAACAKTGEGGGGGSGRAGILAPPAADGLLAPEGLALTTDASLPRLAAMTRADVRAYAGGKGGRIEVGVCRAVAGVARALDAFAAAVRGSCVAARVAGGDARVVELGEALGGWLGVARLVVRAERDASGASEQRVVGCDAGDHAVRIERVRFDTDTGLLTMASAVLRGDGGRRVSLAAYAREGAGTGSLAFDGTRQRTLRVDESAGARVRNLQLALRDGQATTKAFDKDGKGGPRRAIASMTLVDVAAGGAALVDGAVREGGARALAFGHAAARDDAAAARHAERVEGVDFAADALLGQPAPAPVALDGELLEADADCQAAAGREAPAADAAKVQAVIAACAGDEFAAAAALCE